MGPWHVLLAAEQPSHGQGGTYAGGVHRIRLLGLLLLLSQRRIRPVSVGPGIGGLLLRGRLVCPAGRRGGRLAGGGRGLAAAHELLLPLVAILVGGKGGVAGAHQGVLDGPHVFEREDGLGRDGARHRFLPRLEHLVHLPPRAIVDLGVGAHEYRVELRAKIQGVGRGDVLDDRVEYVERGQCAGGRRLGAVSLCSLSVAWGISTHTFLMWLANASEMAKPWLAFSRAMLVSVAISMRELTVRSSRACR